MDEYGLTVIGLGSEAISTMYDVRHGDKGRSSMQEYGLTVSAKCDYRCRIGETFAPDFCVVKRIHLAEHGQSDTDSRSRTVVHGQSDTDSRTRTVGHGQSNTLFRHFISSFSFFLCACFEFRQPLPGSMT